jgi:hypothetical protein
MNYASLKIKNIYILYKLHQKNQPHLYYKLTQRGINFNIFYSYQINVCSQDVKEVSFEKNKNKKGMLLQQCTKLKG